jgi:hypothetical protein
MDSISVRDWRGKPPLRLRVTQKPKTCWWWIRCTRCPHMAAVAIAPFVIRWGPDGWQDMLPRHSRCTECGQRGVALQHPSVWRLRHRLGADADQMAPVKGNCPPAG